MNSKCIIVILVFMTGGLNALGNKTWHTTQFGKSKIFRRHVVTGDMMKAAIDPGPLVKYGLFCRKLPIEAKGSDGPESGPPPIKYTIYIIDETTPNTLHMVVENVEPSFRYDYLVVMAVNEDGVPIGHFHLLVCANGARRSGMWVLGLRCNKGKDPDRSIRKKYGNPHLMYVERDPGGEKLSEQSIFWSWIPADLGKRPTLIQFRIGVIQNAQKAFEGGKDKFWLIITHRIKFEREWVFTAPLASEGIADLDNPLSDDKDEPERCYDNPLTANTPGNFRLTDSTVEIKVHELFLSSLFPVWFDHPDSEKRREHLERLKEQIRQQIVQKDLSKEIKNFMLPPSTASSLRKTKNHKEIYNGCSIVKNCIGDTANCVDLKNCQSLITYKNMKYEFQFENYIHFEMQVNLGKDYGYAAMGLSKDRNMGDDSVVECYVDQSGAFGVYSSWNFPNKTNARTGSNCTNEMLPGENLKRCRVVLKNNILGCSFSLRRDLHVPDVAGLPSKEYNLDKKTFYLLRASGSKFVKGTSPLPWNRKKEPNKKNAQSSKKKKRVTRDSQSMNNIAGRAAKVSSMSRALSSHRSSDRVSGIGKHDKHYTTDRMLSLPDLEDIDEEPPKLKYIKWHVAIVVVAFIGLIPNGVYVARYFKETWTAAMIFNTSIWRLVHWFYMLAVICLIFVDFCVLLSFDHERMGAQSSTHRFCGYLLYATVLFIQPLLGILTSYLKDTVLYIVRIGHWGIGTLVKLFTSILIAFSPQMTDTRIFIGIWVICFLDLLFNIIMHVVMTVLYHSEDVQVFKNRRHSHGRWNRAFNPLPMQKIHQAMPGERRRLLLYLLFQSGTAIFASLIIIPYAGYNSLYICKDDPLLMYKVICQNPAKFRKVL